MELRRFAVCLAFFVLAVSQCSEARHSMRRRQAYDDNINYDDNLLADEAGDEDTQNDTDNGYESEPEVEKAPAAIETPPTNYEVEAGGDVRLECKVSPDAASVVQWSRNNVPYFLGSINLHKEDARYSIVNNSKDLLITNAQGADSGVFKCEIMQGVPVAINHTLLVKEKPQVIEMTATNGGQVTEDDQLTITCKVTGSPAPSVVWSLKREGQDNDRLTEKDGEFLTKDNVYSLYIKNVKREQAGQYFCYAFSKAGTHQAATMVIVNRKPRVLVSKTIVNSDLNIEAVLQCSAHEEPMPHFRWFKDGVLIEDSSSNYKISTMESHSNLTVTPTTDRDFGTFTCEAENEFGSHNRSIELVERPVVEDVEVEGTKMSWTVHSHQPLEAMEVQLRSDNENSDGEWRQLDVPLPEGGRHMYEVSYLLEDKQLESGNYQAIIKVKNSKSWGSTDEPVVFKLEDDQPQYIQHASVFRENAAHSIRPEMIALSTLLLSLFARML